MQQTQAMREPVRLWLYFLVTNKHGLDHGASESGSDTRKFGGVPLIPLYNEEEFVAALLERVVAAPLPDGLDGSVATSRGRGLVG